MRWTGKGRPGQRQVDGGLSDPLWPEPWVGGGQGHPGPGGSTMAFAVCELRHIQHASAVGRLRGSWSTGLRSDHQGTFPVPFSADAGHGRHKDRALFCEALGN